MNDLASFRRTMQDYYKRERDRAERCLDDIIEIMREEGSDADHLNHIIDRIVDHYNHDGRGA